jgi:hypothetical protein
VDRTLDFLVIGAAKCGTTSLWDGLRSHPDVRVPVDKERGFFDSEPQFAKGLARYMRTVFRDAAPHERLGTVAPGLMRGRPERTREVVERIAAGAPGARFVAILRDPIEREVSLFRSAARHGRAMGATFDEHVAGMAEAGRPECPLSAPQDGDYADILDAYVERFGRNRLLILFMEDLDADPARLYRALFGFLGVDPAHPVPDRRMNVGGMRPRLPAEAIEEAKAYMDEHIWPLCEGDHRDARRAFNWWFKHVWNIERDDAGREVGAQLRRRLQERYLPGARGLRDRFGVTPPWLDAYEHAAG